VRPRVPLQVEGVVEALPAEGAQVPLDVRVALHVSVEEALQGEGLVADATAEVGLTVFGGDGCYFGFVFSPGSLSDGLLVGEGVLDAVAAVHELQLHLGGEAQL
jgi:hypothetical protein